MDTQTSHAQEKKARKRWPWLAVPLAALALAASALYITSRFTPRSEELRLQEQVSDLSSQLQQLRQEQAMPAVVLTRYRNSICYIYGLYQVGVPNRRPALRARISGTGFIVGDGLLATNRHALV
jgi:hypothetical protein